MRCVKSYEVFDSDLGELKTLRGLAFESPALELYHRALIAYLEHDVEELIAVQSDLFRLVGEGEDFDLPTLSVGKHDVSSLTTSLVKASAANGFQNPPIQLSVTTDAELVLELVRLRIQCRKHAVGGATVATAENFAAQNPAWAGEIYFVVSAAYAILEDQKKSRDAAQQASQHLKAVGAKRKSVRALMNALAAESVLRPKKRYIPDLQHIYSQAKLVQDWGTMGTVLLNLAHEYRKLGALNAALKFSERAVALQAKRNPGKLDHHFALLNCAHVLIDLKRAPEARALIEEIDASEFAEIQSGLKVLRERYPRLFKTQAPASALVGLTPTWRERSRAKALPRLSASEENLIQILSRKPLPLETLLDKLYGDKIDFESRKNRFYNLLNRIKQKHAGLIHSRQGVYGLKERPIFAPGARGIRS